MSEERDNESVEPEWKLGDEKAQEEWKRWACKEMIRRDVALEATETMLNVVRNQVANVKDELAENRVRLNAANLALDGEREKVKAYEKVISSRKSTTVFRPGEKVFVRTGFGVDDWEEARIVSVCLRKHEVAYQAAFFKNGFKGEPFFEEDEVTDELPLPFRSAKP